MQAPYAPDPSTAALWLIIYDPDVSKIRLVMECYYLHAEYNSAGTKP